MRRPTAGQSGNRRGWHRSALKTTLPVQNWLRLATLTAVGIYGVGLLTATRSAHAQQLAQASPSVTYPTLAAGSTGESVSRLQATLKLLGFYQGDINGTYSPTTQAAVSRFQSAAGIPVDGIAGPSTWRKLLPPPEDISTVASTPAPVATSSASAVVPPAESPATPVSEPTGPPTLRPNVEGSAVAQLQRELQTLGYYDGAINGVYGESTQSAVREFQADQKLEVDAIVGPSTWDALTRALG